MINNVTEISSLIIEYKVKKNMMVVDATCGNGHDSLKLSKLVGKEGKVYSFDIQEEAIENTKKLLKENNLLGNCEVILDSHENLKKYINEEIDFAIFNLGYLPGGNKNIITKSNSSLNAVEACMDLLKKEGFIVICAYLGHEGGREEYEVLKEALDKKNKKEFNIIEISHLARRESSPRMILIEKI